MSAKEPGQKTFEAYESAFVADSGPIAKALPWDEYANKDFWARVETIVEAPHLAELASLRARVAKLESEVVAPLQGLVELHRESSAKWEAHSKEMFRSAAERGERIKELDAELAETEAMRQAEIKERKRAEARVRHWETATSEASPRIVKAKLRERAEIIAKLGEALRLACDVEGHMDPECSTHLRELVSEHASLSQEPCAVTHASGLTCMIRGPHEKHYSARRAGGCYVWLEPRGSLFDIDGHVVLWDPGVVPSEREDPGAPAWSNGQFARDAASLDAALHEVPLDADEKKIAESETGINASGLATRLRDRVIDANASQELPPDLPAPGRDRDMPRAPTVDRMEAEPARDEQDHVHEVGSCSFCDRSLRQGATPCLTWQGPEYGGGCRACGRSREEHEGRAK